MTAKSKKPTPEEIEQALTQRDAIVVLSIAHGLHGRWTQMLEEVSRGQRRNTNWTQGYLECLRDTERTLNETARALAVPPADEAVSNEETEHDLPTKEETDEQSDHQPD